MSDSRSEQKIRFVENDEVNYIAFGAVPRQGADVAFKPSFLNTVFFAKDKGVIYVNGKRYGSTRELQGDRVVGYKPMSKDEPARLVVERDGERSDVDLFRLDSISPNTLKVLVGDDGNYKIGLNIDALLSKQEGNALMDMEGLALFLGIRRTEGGVSLGRYDREGGFHSFGEITGSDIVGSSLKGASIEEADSGMSVVRLHWTDGRCLDIPFADNTRTKVTDTVKRFAINGHELTEELWLSGNDISVGEPLEEPADNSFNTGDKISTALHKLNNRIADIESHPIVLETDILDWKD